VFLSNCRTNMLNSKTTSKNFTTLYVVIAIEHMSTFVIKSTVIQTHCIYCECFVLLKLAVSISVYFTLCFTVLSSRVTLSWRSHIV